MKLKKTMMLILTLVLVFSLFGIAVSCKPSSGEKAEITPTNATFDYKNPQDLIFTVKLNKDVFFGDFRLGEVYLDSDAFTFEQESGKLTIKKEYLIDAYKNFEKPVVQKFMFITDLNEIEITVTVTDTRQAATVANPVKSFDGSNPTAISFAITMNDAVMTAVRIGGEIIPASAYTFTGGVLTFTNAIVPLLKNGENTIVFVTDIGSLNLTVNAVNVEEVGTDLEKATLSVNQATFFKDAQADVSFTFVLNDALFTGLEREGVSLSSSNYSVSNNVFTIKKEYLTSLSSGKNKLIIVTSLSDFEVFVTVVPAFPSATQLKNDPYYNVILGTDTGFPEIPSESGTDYDKYLRYIAANQPLAVGEEAVVTFAEEWWDMRLRPYTMHYDAPVEAPSANFVYVDDAAASGGKGILMTTNGIMGGRFDYIEFRGTKLLADRKSVV